MARQGLTPKQERFAQVYVETSNASEAYRQAYDVGKDTKPECVWVKASELMSNGKVAVRVMEIQAANRKRHEITVDTITDMYQTAYAIGVDEQNSSGVSTAATGMAKLHGLITDKTQVNSTVSVTTSESVAKDIADSFGGK